MNHLSSTSFHVFFSSKTDFIVQFLQEAPIWVKMSLFTEWNLHGVNKDFRVLKYCTRLTSSAKWFILIQI